MTQRDQLAREVAGLSQYVRLSDEAMSVLTRKQEGLVKVLKEQEKEKEASADRLAHALLTVYEEFAEAGEVKTLNLEEYKAQQKDDRERSDRLISEFEASFNPPKP